MAEHDIPPTLEIYSPLQDAVIREASLQVSGSANNYYRNGGEQVPTPVSVIISVTGAGSQTIQADGDFVSPPFNFTEPGQKTITAQVSGLPAIRRRVQIDFDLVAPDVQITEPREEDRRRSEPGPNFSVTIKGTATDLPADNRSGIYQVQYRVGPSGTYNPIPQHTGNDNEWEWSQEITVPRPGAYTIYFRASDKFKQDRWSEEKSLTITFVDSGAPKITITSPDASPYIITWAEGGVPVEIAGTASDPTTGVQSVEWRLEGEAAWHTATKDSETWSHWRFTAHLPAPGLYDIAVRAADGAGNASTETVQIDVAVPFELEDVDVAAYLEDLMIFTRRRVRATGTVQLPLDKAHLTTTLYQRFDRLTEPSFQACAVHPVAQVRIAVEVLRRLLHNYAQFPHYGETGSSTFNRGLRTTAQSGA